MDVTYKYSKGVAEKRYKGPLKFIFIMDWLIPLLRGTLELKVYLKWPL